MSELLGFIGWLEREEFTVNTLVFCLMKIVCFPWGVYFHSQAAVSRELHCKVYLVYVTNL